VVAAAECQQRGGDEAGVVDRRVPFLLEPAPQPPCGRSAVADWVLLRDQRGELERVGEIEPRELACDRLRDE
jgi:hypothetical protein